MATIGELMLLWDIRDELKRANDLVEEERVRREWEKWDREVKEGVIKRLRDPNDILNLLTLNQQPIYDGISKEKQAALIESGELKIIAQTQGAKPIISSMWADDSREEAQNPTYRKLKAINLKEIEQGIRRVVM